MAVAQEESDMTLFNQLVSSQQTTGELIENIIRNVKKDSASRKTLKYYEDRLRRLDVAWSEFETTDSKIRCLENIPEDHKYFTEKYYDNVSELAMKYRNIFEAAMMDASKGSAAETNQAAAVNKPTASTRTTINNGDTVSPLSSLTPAIRRQNVMMGSLKRLLTMDPTAANMQLKEKLWEQIQNLHFSIWEGCHDPLTEGYDMNSYTKLEQQVIENFKLSSSTAPEQRVQPEQNNILPLPKITIPKFDGDYLKWRAFCDLFSQLVHNQQLPTVQKMWYLKSNVVGEAEKLINHLSATAENYTTAWELLQERYNNQRVLVASLMHQLLDQPSSGSSAAAIKELHDNTQECVHALRNIGIDTTSWDPILLHILVKKLDRGTHILYERSITNPKELPQLKQFLEFLETRFQSMQALGRNEKSSSKTCASAASSNQSDKACIVCKIGSHPLFKCQQFHQLTPSERLKFAQQQRLCVNCLKPGHGAKNCTLRSCTKCNRKHNSLLHLESANITSKQESLRSTDDTKETSSSSMALSAKEENDMISPNESEAASLTAANKQPLNSYVLLSTAVVKVKGKNTEIECRALLDSGSQVNFITERLAKRLGISMQPSSVNISGIGSTNTRTQHRINVELNSRINGFSTRLEAFVLPRIISPQPAKFINTDEWSLPKNLVLADPAFNRPDRIDILLGAEHYHQLLSIGQIKLEERLPILQNTVFGWVVSGKLQEEHSTNVVCGVGTSDEGLEMAIARLWELDEVKTDNKSLSMAEKQCEEHFFQHTSKNNENRFVVKIPFCQNPDVLGDSHTIALNRFLSLERRLQKDPTLRSEYIKFMNEYEAMGHMTKVAADNVASPNYFIPHHCVLRPNSSTTKLRVVFDASAKSSSGYSLNDLMYTGPTVQSELFSILLRFRFPRFVFTTDVEKMYRQILISPEDRQFQLIIWREDSTKPLNYYQLNTVTYGTRAAPYLATKCLQQLAQKNFVRYPLAAQFLQENFYVDDGLGGADSLVATIQLQEQLTQIMKESGFNLRKWCANHPQLLHHIPQSDLEVNLDFESSKADAVKTLGLTWMPKDDKLCVKVNIETIKRVTKRTVTSDLARLFDPLGILSPIVVTAKIFIQELWELKLDWDQSLPEELHTKWITFRNELNSLKTLQISRHIFKGGIPESMQLHIFTDASEKAYGAAAFVRSVFQNGTILTRLLCAKSRVAPLKKQTVPRLELCAAVLGAQLATKIKTDLQLTNPIWFWTDSEIVLYWIHSSSALFNTFVANRVSIIQETTQAEQWRHVSSKHNPADILSRGMTPSALKECIMWFCGPLFLHGKEDCWPPKFNPTHTNEVNLERKRKAPESLILAVEESNFVYNINHKNSFLRLQRIVAYVLRFINHTRCESTLRSRQQLLTTTELDQALVTIIKQVQAAEFKEEIQHLAKYKELRGTSTLSNLSPFLDKNGLIRVGGRLDAAALPHEAKHQLLIPYNDPISKLIFEMVHRENKHCGTQTVLGIVRQRYWPIKGKIMARATIHRCTICSRAKPMLFNQVMGNLPAARVTPARPFVNSGVDYCGPIMVHYKIRGKRPHKAYIAVFCCFVTKAVHLELVSDLTTDAFIGALKRFISRRGHCQNLYCDNATNFVGAKNQLPELLTIIHSTDAQEAITNTCNKNGIQFNFIPPRAPHFGGLWEAAVKSAKHLLVRSLGKASLTYEELETLVIEIEAILNSRPISPMSNDPNDVTALTPGHFLIGEPLTAQIDAQAQPTTTSLATRWKLVSRLKHEFWNRWSRDYLNELQYRNKWQERSKNLKEGEVVIVKDDNTPVMQWPLGQVIKIYKGTDDIVRVADVKTASGIFKRAVRYLAPLPRCDDENEGSNQQQAKDNLSLSDEHKTQADASNSNNIDILSKPNNKRQKMAALPSMPILLIALFALPLLLAEKIKITKFNSDIGIYFEGIGSTRLSRSEWNIISYYELKPYWREMATFTNGTKALDHLCNLINQRSTCTNALQTLELSLADLKDENMLLRNKRVKRGAVNVIGNIANSLFGILDSNYADQMSSTINTIKENENNLKQYLRNQTSIIDATLNVYKQDEQKIKEKFDNLDTQLTEIISRIRKDEQENHQVKLFQIFISLSVQLSIISSRLHRIQSSIVTALADSHHGQISPMLLSPSQLESELVQIRNHLPTTLQLPVTQDNLLQLYKMMSVKGGITEDHVIFHITIPLCSPERFELFKPHPIPSIINNTLIAIKPCGELLAINQHRDQYFVLDEKHWRSCITLKEDELLCPNIQSTLNTEANKCSCEIALFNNNTRTNCNIATIDSDLLFTQLEHNNQWLYTMTHPSRITAVCGHDHSQLTLTGSGLLTIKEDCTLKHKTTIIQGHQAFSSLLKASYIASANISDITHPSQMQTLLQTSPINQYTDHLKNISDIQTKLHQQILTELPSQIQLIKYHHATVAYLALILAVGTIIIIVYRKMQCRKGQLCQPPTPATRQHVTPSDFITTVT